MVKIILREIFIFALCVSIFPGALFALYVQGEIGQSQLMALAREIASTAISGPWPIISLLGKLLTPYLIVQAVRAYKWSRLSVTGLRYSNLYYALLMFGLVVWFWGQSSDLLYFMYAMDDLPAELPQFLEMEAANLLMGALSLYLAISRFRVFLYAVEPPDRKTPSMW